METMLRTLCFAGLCCFVFGARGAKAQAAEPLKWDVVSVKPMSADECKAADSGGVRYLPNGLSASCVPVLFAVEFAYHLMDPTRIVGLPKWALGSQMYGIEARVSASDAAAFAKLKRDEKSDMMQAVFADRFGMKTHRETRELPAYALVVAKGGPKMTVAIPASGGMGRSQFGGSTGEVKWVDAPLTDLKFLLANETGRPVVDRTGLTGNFTFKLEYTPSSQEATDTSGRPSIFTALEGQLGLKLVPAKQAVELLVVDSLERPSEN
jgi:uncharacterized protein (TIGR03435 family)